VVVTLSIYQPTLNLRGHFVSNYLNDTFRESRIVDQRLRRKPAYSIPEGCLILSALPEYGPY